MKSGKKNKMKNNVTPLPAPGKQIINPAKEFDMTPEDLKLAQELKVKQFELMQSQKALEQLRYDYNKKEKLLMSEWDMHQHRCDQIHKQIKEAHKIIGDLDHFDLDRKKIIIK